MSAANTPQTEHGAIAERIIGNIVQAGSPGALARRLAGRVRGPRVDLAKNELPLPGLARADGRIDPTGAHHERRARRQPDLEPGRRHARIHLASRREEGRHHPARPPRRRDRRGSHRRHDEGRSRQPCAGVPTVDWIAFTSRTRDERYEAEDESWQAPRKIEHFFTQLNGEGWIFDRPSHIYVVPSDGTGTPRNLTPGRAPAQRVRLAAGLVRRRHVVGTSRHLGPRPRHRPVPRAARRRDPRPHRSRPASTSTRRSRPTARPSRSSATTIRSSYPQNVHVGLVPLDGGDHIAGSSRALDRTFETTAGTAAPIWLDDTTLLGTAGGPWRDPPVPGLGRRRHAREGHLRTDHRQVVRRRRRARSRTAPGPSTRSATCSSSRDGSTAPAHRLRRPLPHRGAAAHVGAVRRAVHRRHRRDRRVDHAPGRLRPDRRYPVLLNVHGGPHTQYGETLLRRGPDAGRRRFRRADVQPPRRFGSGAALGPGDHRSEAPEGARAPVGDRVDVDDVLAVLDTTLARLPVLRRHRVGMHRRQLRRLHGHVAGRPDHGDRFRAICSERAVNNMLTEEFTSDIATIFRVEHGPDHLERPRRVRAHVADPLRARHHRARCCSSTARTTSAVPSARPRSCSSPCGCSART